MLSLVFDDVSHPSKHPAFYLLTFCIQGRLLLVSTLHITLQHGQRFHIATLEITA